VRGTDGAIRRGLGAWAGVVAEKPGDMCECACAGPRRRAERAELTGLAHDTEREKGTHESNGSALANQAHETEREGERAGEVTGADRAAPLGSERERKGAHEGEPPLTGGVRMSGGAGVRARGLAGLNWAGWAAFSFSFFLWIFKFLFSISFSIGFSNPNSN
jgi:hypothetical protein